MRSTAVWDKLIKQFIWGLSTDTLNISANTLLFINYTDSQHDILHNKVKVYFLKNHKQTGVHKAELRFVVFYVFVYLSAISELFIAP